MKPIDLVGKRFGRLLVISFAGKNNNKRWWTCKCDCGIEKLCNSPNLLSGDTKSCGCLHKERSFFINKKHGLSSTNEFAIWMNVFQRCYNEKNPGYSNYGGRGIRMSEEWKADFTNFLNDMGERPSLEYSIERINNNGDYEKSNCKWATRKEQSWNKRTVLNLTLNGITKPAAEWAKSIPITYPSLKRRLKSSAWSLEDALTMPRKRKGQPR